MDTTPWVGWKHRPWKTGGETGDKIGGTKTGDRRNVFWFSPKKSENVPSVPGFSVQAIDGAGGGRAVHRQREVAAFPGGQRLGRQRGGLLDGERATVQRDGALPAFAGELQRTAV